MRDAVLWDTGLRSGACNLAFDRCQRARTRCAGLTILRLHRSHPTASIGAHEAAHQSLRLSYCRRRGLAVVRRLTGGGAYYLDRAQLGWTLTAVPREVGATLAEVLERAGRGVARGLRTLGVEAASPAPDVVEVAGRKLGAVCARLDAGVVTAQGTLLVDVDVETMLKVLRVPREKLTPEGVAGARQRLVTLNELMVTDMAWPALRAALARGLALELGVSFERRAPRPAPRRAAARVAAGGDEMADAYEAFEKTAGGVLYAALEVADGRVRRARLTGAVQLRPPRLLEGLAARLAGVRLERVAAVGRAFLATRDRELVGLGDEDVVRVLARASARRAQRRALGLTPGQVNTLMVHDPHGAGETTELLRRAEVVLVPYCAKPTWCKYRHREGCPECGRCEVGEVYRLGRERGLSVITIRNFEHLRETLARLRARGIEAYMGMCCSQFYLKREYAFREAGIPALLMDISGSNCYELGQEELAYQGRFEAQARLNAPVVERVLRFVPPRATEAPRPRRRRQGAG